MGKLGLKRLEPYDINILFLQYKGSRSMMEYMAAIGWMLRDLEIEQIPMDVEIIGEVALTIVAKFATHVEYHYISELWQDNLEEIKAFYQSVMEDYKI